MDPIVIVILVWFIAAPLLLVLWLISRRKLRRLVIESAAAAATHKDEATRLAADHKATKAKYSAIISQEAEVARLLRPQAQAQ